MITVYALSDSRVLELNPLSPAHVSPVLLIVWKAVGVLLISQLEKVAAVKWPGFPRRFYISASVVFWSITVWNVAIIAVSKVSQ